MRYTYFPKQELKFSPPEKEREKARKNPTDKERKTLLTRERERKKNLLTE